MIVLVRYPSPAAFRATRAVARFGLALDVCTRVRALSLGNRQRLGLALALIHEPELVVLDGPVNGLDPAGVVDVRNLLGTWPMRGSPCSCPATSSARSSAWPTASASSTAPPDRGTPTPTALQAAARPQLRVTLRDPAMATKAAQVLSLAGLEVEADGATVLSSEPRALVEPEWVVTRLVHAQVPPRSVTVERDDLESHFLHLTEARSA